MPAMLFKLLSLLVEGDLDSAQYATRRAPERVLLQHY